MYEILNERKNTHGNWPDQCKATAAIKAVVYNAAAGKGITDEMEEAIDMIATKLGRIATGDPHFEDHWRDIAGYATLVADQLKPPVTNTASAEAAIRALSAGSGWTVDDMKRISETINKLGKDFSRLGL